MATTENLNGTMLAEAVKPASVPATNAATTTTTTNVAAAAATGASTTTSPDKKRPAEESAAPSMTKAAAAKSLSSLKVPKMKNKSQYVRFKSLLLKDAKDRGDTETSGNITKVAKEAWASVKHLTPPPPIDPATNTNTSLASATSNLSDDMQRYLRLKGRVMKDEQDDEKKFNADVKAYLTAFVPAATSHLQWQVIEATEDNFASLEEAIDYVSTKYESSAELSGVDKSPLFKGLKDARTQLAQLKELNSKRLAALKELNAERSLVAELRNATEDDLLQHVKEHRRLLKLEESVKQAELKKQAEEEKQRQEEEAELSQAGEIEGYITDSLHKQMKYHSGMKDSSAGMTFILGGVSQKLFAKAFDVAVGTKKATIRGCKVQRKTLRYGAFLQCSDINVKLVGDELIAQASYFMMKW